MGCVTLSDVEFFNILLTAITLILACLGLRAWRIQLEGSFVFNKKKELISELRKFKGFYHDCCYKLDFLLQVIDEPIEKPVFTERIVIPMKEQYIEYEKSLKLINSSILEISPSDKKMDKKWQSLDVMTILFQVNYDLLLFDIEYGNTTIEETKNNINKSLNPEREKMMDQGINDLIKFLEHRNLF